MCCSRCCYVAFFALILFSFFLFLNSVLIVRKPEGGYFIDVGMDMPWKAKSNALPDQYDQWETCSIVSSGFITILDCTEKEEHEKENAESYQVYSDCTTEHVPGLGAVTECRTVKDLATSLMDTQESKRTSIKPGKIVERQAYQPFYLNKQNS